VTDEVATLCHRSIYHLVSDRCGGRRQEPLTGFSALANDPNPCLHAMWAWVAAVAVKCIIIILLNFPLIL
jgi:hypothetical protein